MSSIAYRPEIDGLRAIAVLVVIFFHAGFKVFGGGYVGVDVFFVISGYLITSIIAGELAAGRFSIVKFYERRARRILPALFFVMAVCLPLAWLLMTPQQLKGFSQSLVATAAFSSNLFFWQTSGYFDAAAELKPLLHTWSLGVEEQYYLLFPLLLMLVRGRAAFLLVLVLSVGSYAFGLWLRQTDITGAFFLAPARAWELFAGSALALISQGNALHKRLGAMPLQLLSLTGLLLILGSVFYFDEHSLFPSLPLTAPVLGTMLVIAFGVKGTVTARLLSLPIMVGIGLLSYSAYLWHQPVLAFLRLRDGTGLQAAEQWLACLGSIGLAYLSWRFVETPFRSSEKVSRRTIFIGSGVVSALVMAIGVAGHLRQGFPERLDAQSLALLDSTVRSPKREACHTEGVDYLPPKNACTYFGKRITWAALGDSHVVEPAYVLAETLKARNEGLLHLSFSGCAPALLYQSWRPGCTAWQEDAVRELESRGELQNVLVGFRYTAAIFGTQTSGYPEYDNQIRLDIPGQTHEQAAELVWQSFAQLLERLNKAGKRVYVITPIPELGSHIDSFIWRHDGEHSMQFVDSSRAYYEGRNAYILQRFATLPWGEKLLRINSADALCDASNCFAVKQGKALYSDDSHLSLNGARLLLEKQPISVAIPSLKP
ncbi:MAG: acyltransferase family protein [Pseudomonadota bacterium]